MHIMSSTFWHIRIGCELAGPLDLPPTQAILGNESPQASRKTQGKGATAQGQQVGWLTPCCLITGRMGKRKSMPLRSSLSVLIQIGS
jgi:predicted small lipoprotein YifL